MIGFPQRREFLLRIVGPSVAESKFDGDWDDGLVIPSSSAAFIIMFHRFRNFTAGQLYY